MSNGILIADDHEATRLRLRALLERAGWRVCGEAINGQEAIEKAIELKPGLVILDISMPLMTGLGVIPEILKCAPQVKILMFTVHEADELRRQAFRLGAHGFVAKSAPGTELLAEVKRLSSGTS